MPRTGAERAAALAATALLLILPACGKKAPLRLPEDRPAEVAPPPRARIREGRVRLDLLVPRHRAFPERENPWILARVMRLGGEGGGKTEFVEVGAILAQGGFEFGARLAWEDREQPPGSYAYRVEFRDAARGRRAVSAVSPVVWDAVPAGPARLVAIGAPRSIALSWEASPAASPGTSYRIYRREPARDDETTISPEALSGIRYLDSRVERGRDYCYTVRAVMFVGGLEVESSATPEACARALEDEPSPRPPAAVP